MSVNSSGTGFRQNGGDVALIFRETLPSDVEVLFSVRGRTRENPLSSEQLEQFGITTEVIAGHIAGGRIKGWVCWHESDVVGFCNGDAETGEVLVLAVLPEYESRGIGTTLLAHVVEWLRSVGFNTPWLAASPNAATRAHGFYRSLGWQSSGKIGKNGDEILVLPGGQELSISR